MGDEDSSLISSVERGEIKNERRKKKNNINGKPISKKIEFKDPNKKIISEYVGLEKDITNEQEIRTYITAMGLKKMPKVLISVVGGMTKLSSHEDSIRKIERTLTKFCEKVGKSEQSTWFITSGLDVGVTKLIAKSLEGHQHSSINTIGVVPSSMIYEGKNMLLSKRSLFRYPLHQFPQNVEAAKETPNEFYLNKDHTHFFLVQREQPTGILKFRNSVEKFIMKEVEGDNAEEVISAVKLVIGGGRHTLEEIENSLSLDDAESRSIIPIVVLANSGKVSQWIANYMDHVQQQQEKEQQLKETPMFEDIKKYYPDDADKIIEKLGRITEHRHHFITICTENDILEEKVLQALATDDPRRNRNRPIELPRMIFPWENIDVVRQNFENLLKDPNVPEQKIYEIMETLLMKSLLKEKIDFLNMILEFGIDIDKFNREILCKLYSKALKGKNPEKSDESDASAYSINLFKSLRRYKTLIEEPEPKEDPITSIRTYSRAGKRKSKAENEHSSDDETDYGNKLVNKKKSEEFMLQVIKTINKVSSLTLYDTKILNENSKKKNEDSSKDESDDVLKLYNDPFKDLLLWAVLCNKQKIAEALWLRGENPIAKALVVGRMYKHIADKYCHKSKVFAEYVFEELENNSRFFETKAVEFLGNCSDTNKESSVELIKIEIPSWGNKSLIKLAALSGFKRFMSNPRCKNVLDSEWRGKISSTNYFNLKTLASVIFFLPLFLPLFCLKFEEPKNKSKEKEKSDNEEKACNYGICYRFFAFFNAPVVKFWLESVCYLVFIVIYIKGLLNSLHERPQPFIYTSLVFVISFTLEECRQILKETGINLKQRFKRWFWASNWNAIEVSSIILFILGFALHFVNTISARYLYSMALFFFILKSLKYFSLSSKFGVYIVIIRKLLVDVFVFIVILLILVIGYGVARFSILHPEETVGVDGHTTGKIFMAPFFQLFGEVFIKSIEEAERTNVTVFGTTTYKDDRRFGETILIIFTFIYMMLTCLCLVNLLIAVFNYTYENVRNNAKDIWHLQYYHLVKEYQNRSHLPSPLNILHILCDLLTKMVCCCQEEEKRSNRDTKLLLFETNCLVSYKKEQNMQYDSLCDHCGNEI